MKLIGSKTEEDIRLQLVRSNKSLFQNVEKQGLINVLREKYPELRTAYILDWIPEHGEDIFSVLVDNSVVVKVEVNRDHKNVAIITMYNSLNDYKKGLSKIEQIKIAVAIDLATKELM